ncbi:DUF6235 family protein [Actinomycetospora aeridis]|uniref:DUF6235 family protein n=1 Tax=Actinomycetospora aeridis TaxID=3129231 RepID=A0ABU8NAD1_9PSEU
MITTRLTEGTDVLGAWSDTATQAQRNEVYEVLFALLDGTAPRRCHLTSDGQWFRATVTAEIALDGRWVDEGFEVHFIGRPSARNLDHSDRAG